MNDLVYAVILLLAPPILIWLNKTTKNDLLTLVIGIVLAIFMINSTTDFAIFFSGLFIGYVSDFLGVYYGVWRYWNKYSYYVGFFWGLTALAVIKTANTFLPPVSFLGFLFIERKFSEKKYYRDPKIWLLLALIIFLYRSNINMLLMVFFAGAYIELLGVKSKDWKYKAPMSYLSIGIGYGSVIYLPVIASNYIVSKQIVFVDAIVLSLIYTLLFSKWLKDR